MRCVLACKAGEYPDYAALVCRACSNGCATCQEAGSCLTCDSSATPPLFLQGSTCVSNCQTSTKLTYANTNLATCSLCINPCKECSATDGTSCLSCISGNLAGTQCTQTCPVGQFGGTRLVGGVLQFGLYCQACVAGCDTCTVQSGFCISCPAGKVLNGFSCNTSCAANQFASSRICGYCVNPCASCSSVTTCTGCLFGYYFL